MWLDVQALTADSFAPYGCVIDAGHAGGRLINAGTSQRWDFADALCLGNREGQPRLSLFRAVARDVARPWRDLERHRWGSQTFVPLRGVRSVLLVALGTHAPEISTLRAFLSFGGCAWSLNPGTWHHSLIALDDGDFIVIERHALQPDCDVAELAEPVQLRMPGC